MSGVVAKIGPAVAPQDIGDFDLSVEGSSGADHRRRRALLYPGGMTSSDNRSSGLRVARIVWAATCV